MNEMSKQNDANRYKRYQWRQHAILPAHQANYGLFSKRANKYKNGIRGNIEGKHTLLDTLKMAQKVQSDVQHTSGGQSEERIDVQTVKRRCIVSLETDLARRMFHC